MGGRKAEVILEIVCRLSEEFFGDWEDLTPEQQSVFQNDTAQCDGSGAMGTWCDGCAFCIIFDEEADD